MITEKLNNWIKMYFIINVFIKLKKKLEKRSVAFWGKQETMK